MNDHPIRGRVPDLRKQKISTKKWWIRSISIADMARSDFLRCGDSELTQKLIQAVMIQQLVRLGK